MPEQVLKPRHNVNNVRHNPANMVRQLGKSLQSHDSKQQRDGLGLLAHAAAFSESVKESEGRKFKTIENNFRICSGEWSVPNQGEEIGMMAVGRSTNPINVYYVVRQSL
jgi:hypothetical protein